VKLSLSKEPNNMAKLLIVAVLLAGVSTFVLHSKHTSVTTTLPTTKFDQLKIKANVTMRSFHLPQVNGKVVPFCLSGWNRCGKPAADAFCRSKGFKQAFTFQRNESQASTATNFRQINCGHRTKTADAGADFGH
jgi:hypothetical protein